MIFCSPFPPSSTKSDSSMGGASAEFRRGQISCAWWLCFLNRDRFIVNSRENVSWDQHNLQILLQRIKECLQYLRALLFSSGSCRLNLDLALCCSLMVCWNQMFCCCWVNYLCNSSPVQPTNKCVQLRMKPWVSHRPRTWLKSFIYLHSQPSQTPKLININMWLLFRLLLLVVTDLKLCLSCLFLVKILSLFFSFSAAASVSTHPDDSHSAEMTDSHPHSLTWFTCKSHFSWNMSHLHQSVQHQAYSLQLTLSLQ